VTNLVLDRMGAAITNYKKTSQPFFVGLGTHRPHLGWTYPRSANFAALEAVGNVLYEEKVVVLRR
jgi:hypothetical protein